MQTIAVRGTGLEEIVTDKLDGILFDSRHFETHPRLAAQVNDSLTEHNDLPPNLDKLLETLKEQLSDTSTLIHLVELNPALAAKVLKLVNSSFAGLRGKVSNLKRAANLLGYNHISTLLQNNSVFLRHRHHKLPPALPIEQLWKHSVAVSQIAGAVADSIGNMDSSTLVSAGLVHECGKLVTAAIHPEKFASCLAISADTGTDLVEIELETLGVTHPLLAGALGKMWNLPERMWTLMLYQSHIDIAPDPRMAATLKLAEFMARSHGLGSDGQPADESVIPEVAKALGVPVESAPRLVSHLKMDEIARECHFMTSGK